jgi:hypothetical protein
MSERLAPRATEIRRPVLAGHRRVDALWWPADWFDEADRRRRILASWQAGSRLFRFAQGDLLCLPQPCEFDCDALDAWPLQRIAGTLCSAAMTAAEFAGRPVADAWLALGARLQPLKFDDAEALDPADWLDATLPLVAPMDLRLPEPERELVMPEARPLHEVLGPDVPATVAPETRRLLDALRSAPKPAASTRPSRPGDSGSGLRLGGSAFWILAGLVAMLSLAALMGSSQGGSIIFSLLSWGFIFWVLKGFWPRNRSGHGARPVRSGGQGGASDRAGNGSGGGGLRERLQRSRVVPQRWRQWLARMAATSGVGRLLGGQHAAYMRRVLAMFDEGKLDEALRHAIPLGSDGESLGQAFGRLGPRGDLSLRRHDRATTSIGFGDDFEEHLRQLYRRTFEQLDRAGRIDEAVYVLAELLRVRQEALDYLEKKARFGQAAELALAWDMPPAQIVRLCVLAKDWRTALLVARRDEAFAAAIALLETRSHTAASQLRIEWAEWLAARGRCVEAIQAIWPLTAERQRAVAWLDIADAAGGTIAARSLAWRASGDRRALVDELLRLQAPVDPAARRLAALVAGAVIADQAGSQPTLDKPTLTQFTSFAADPALSADLPSLSSSSLGKKSLLLRVANDLLECPVPPAGLIGIVDALPLGDGEFLVALGEAGAARIDARGRRLAHFNVPAHRLVGADDRGSALALARREKVWRVSRLDLARGQATDLGMHAFDAFADRYDANGWAVGQDRRVQVLDVLSPGLREAVWQVADLPGRVVAIDRGESHVERWLLDVAGDGKQLQQWVYQLPARALQSRDELSAGAGAANQATQRMLVHGRGLFELQPDAKNPERLQMQGFLGVFSVPLLQDADIVHAAEEWLAWRRDAGEHTELQLMRWINGAIQVRWEWPSDAVPHLRFHLGTCLVFDARGRLCALDTATCLQREISLR